MSTDYNFNFIHNPKTGGMSIRNYIKKENRIKYCFHNTNVTNSFYKNQIVVLRDPIDRFKSGVRFMLKNYKNKDPKLYQKLESHNLLTPSAWATALKNKNKLITKLYKSQKYVYRKQSNYVKNHSNVILFKNLDEEFKLFCQKYSLCQNTDLDKKLNQTEKTSETDTLSEGNITFISKVYEKDIELYQEYESKTFDERMSNIAEDTDEDKKIRNVIITYLKKKKNARQ